MTATPDPNTDTVWVEHEALIDRIPRWVAMLGLAIVVIAIWDLATARTGWVSPIILPSPGETLAGKRLDLEFALAPLLTDLDGPRRFLGLCQAITPEEVLGGRPLRRLQVQRCAGFRG